MCVARSEDALRNAAAAAFRVGLEGSIPSVVDKQLFLCALMWSLRCDVPRLRRYQSVSPRLLPWRSHSNNRCWSSTRYHSML